MEELHGLTVMSKIRDPVPATVCRSGSLQDARVLSEIETIQEITEKPKK